MARVNRISKGITRVVEQRNITTQQQKNIRFTKLEEDELSIFVDKIKEMLPKKNISISRVLRACCYLHTDKRILKKIVNSIKDNT